jgi:hypothetical protein
LLDFYLNHGQRSTLGDARVGPFLARVIVGGPVSRRVAVRPGHGDWMSIRAKPAWRLDSLKFA